jgi:hypothetical protein
MMAAPTMREAIEIIKRKFDPSEIKWRIQRSGGSGEKVWAVVIPYITSRAVHDRLDEAFDAWGWRNEFRVMEISSGDPGIICRTHYRNPDTGEWAWKENGASQTGIEPFKGGLSGSEKRTFEHSLDEEFAITALKQSEKCPHYARTKDGQVFYWGAPNLPAWARPDVAKAIVEEGAEVVGDVKMPQEYPDWNALVEDHGGKKGINELRNVAVVAKSKGWTQSDLFAWIAKQGVDLSDSGLQYSDFAKLNHLIKGA